MLALRQGVHVSRTSSRLSRQGALFTALRGRNVRERFVGFLSTRRLNASARAIPQSRNPADFVYACCTDIETSSMDEDSRSAIIGANAFDRPIGASSRGMCA